MAFTTSNVTFKTTHAYLTEADWEFPFQVDSNSELHGRSVLYENEFAINPYSNSVLTNKYGEMLIRQLIDDEEGEYMYYVVVFDNLDCECCYKSFLVYSHTHFDSSLEYILENYFNDAPTNDGYVGLDEEDDCYASIHPECDGIEMDEYDPEEYDRLGWEHYVSQHPPKTIDEEIVYTEEDGCQLYQFTTDYSLIPSVDRSNSNYSSKYQLVVSACGLPIQTPSGQYLSRMKKDNGSFRYYLTSVVPELESDDLCYKMTMFYVFKSKYIGKDLTNALQEYVYAP
jgi:hypothetical protein